MMWLTQVLRRILCCICIIGSKRIHSSPEAETFYYADDGDNVDWVALRVEQEM